MNRNSGWAARTAPITSAQYSVAGAGPASAPQVRENTELTISMAMSQRTPSAWPAMSASVSMTARRSDGANASSWATSGHGAKYGSRPRATIDEPTWMKAAGSAANASAVPSTKRSGWSTTHGWSGATWFGTKST